MAAPPVWLLLGRWDVAFLGCVFLEVFADFTTDGALLFFLSENFGGSDTFAASALGLIAAFRGVMTIALGPLLDRWPARGPLKAAAFGRALAFLVLLLTVALERSTAGYASARPLAYGATVVLLLAGYAGAEALASMGATLWVQRVSQGRDERVRPALFQLQYATVNLAAFLAAACSSSVRALCDGDSRRANWVLVAAGALVFLAAAAALAWLHQQFEGDARMHAPAHAQSSIGPSVFLRVCESRGSRAVLARYLGLVLAMAGTRAAFAHQSITLGKYMVRRFDERSLFALFQSINPLVMTALGLLTPALAGLVPGAARVPSLVYLALGTLTQALAPFWILVAPTREWPVVAYALQFSLGEAIGMPQLSEYTMQLLPRGRESSYISVGQVPSVPITIGVAASSGLLLQAYCATPAACQAPTAPLLWVWVAGASLVTPLALTALGLAQRHTRGTHDTPGTETHARGTSRKDSN